MDKTTSETELLQASIAGSTEAFGVIIERYQSLICGITYSATGDFTKSQDLAQETFIRAWKGLSRLKDLSNFRAWLCTIARNMVKGFIAGKQKDIIKDAQPLESAVATETTKPGPGQTAISKEQQAIVWEALRKIPEAYREPMVLFYREQKSVKQVAAGLGLSEDAAKQRLSRGRKLLKTEVSTLVEDVLGQTGPKRAFTIAVVAALPALTTQTASAAVAGAVVKGAPVAKIVFSTALVGAILGPILGLLGGIFGSWMSIKHTRSPRERKFMVKMSIIVWLMLLLLIGLPLGLAIAGVIPKWVYWSVFVVFFVVLLPMIFWINNRTRQIQKEDGTYIEPEYTSTEIPKWGIYGAFGGAIFGSVFWIVPMSCLTRDWLTIIAVTVFAGLIFTISTKKLLRKQEMLWRILVWDMISLCVLNLAVVNLRWSDWMSVLGYQPKYSSFSLLSMNVIIGVVMGMLILLFLILDTRQRRKVVNKSETQPE